MEGAVSEKVPEEGQRLEEKKIDLKNGPVSQDDCRKRED